MEQDGARGLSLGLSAGSTGRDGSEGRALKVHMACLHGSGRGPQREGVQVAAEGNVFPLLKFVRLVQLTAASHNVSQPA